MKSIAAFLVLLIASLCRGADIGVTYNFTVAPLAVAQQQRIEGIRSIYAYWLTDNGLTGTSAAMHFAIKPAHLGTSGPLASTPTASYKINSRGKLVLDGAYLITISLNLDLGLATWSDTLLGAVVFHEMGHCFGFDYAVWLVNRSEGGSFSVPNNKYTGPQALAIYRQEFNQPAATFILLDASHFAESIDADEVMTPGLSNSRIALVYVSTTMFTVIQENGWTVRPGFYGRLLTDLTPIP